MARNVKAGEAVLTCDPWISVVHWEKRSEVCASCWKEGKTGLQACTRCRYCHYCNKDGQKAHWDREHQFECKMMKAALEFLSKDQVWMYGWGHEHGYMEAPLILFMKGLNRWAAAYPETHKDFNEETARTFFAEPIQDYRFDIEVPDNYDRSDLGHLDVYRNYVAARVNQRLKQVLTSSQCATLFRNILIAREGIFLDIRDPVEESIGTGVYLDMHKLNVTCKGNCDWFFVGSKIVIKAVMDIPDFRGLDQVTVAPLHYRKRIAVRAERQDYRSHTAWTRGLKQQRLPGDARLSLPCGCAFCSDSLEAEFMPIKCITKACGEPIPSDRRALLPCPKCSAVCGATRLKLAKAQLKEFTKKLLACCKRAEQQVLNMDQGIWWAKRAALVKELQEPRVILHPDNLIRLGLLMQISETLAVQEGSDSLIESSADCAKQLYQPRHAIRKYYPETDPYYHLFLMHYGAAGAARCQIQKDGNHRQGHHRQCQVFQKNQDEAAALVCHAVESLNQFLSCLTVSAARGPNAGRTSRRELWQVSGARRAYLSSFCRKRFASA